VKREDAWRRGPHEMTSEVRTRAATTGALLLPLMIALLRARPATGE
jgi:hypothetical protein